MQFYYVEEPASPLDFDDNDGRDRDHRGGGDYGGGEDSFCAVAAAAAAAGAGKSMAPAISRAGAFRELLIPLRGGSISSELRPERR